MGETQHVQGKWNISDETSLHIVGNGSINTPSNAHTLDSEGNAWFSGDVYVGSTSGTNKDAGSIKLVKENKFVSLTQAEYNALTPEEQLNGTIYFVKDMQHSHTSGTSITMSDNADGGVDISINDITRTLATQSDVAEIKAYIESLENKTEVQY